MGIALFHCSKPSHLDLCLPDTIFSKYVQMDLENSLRKASSNISRKGDTFTDTT